MKNLFITSIAALSILFTANYSYAQATVAMDFNRADCNGTMHHLFTNDLDSGNVVIHEFFMGGGCLPCITAGQTLEIMKSGLMAAHPGKIRAYVSGYSDGMSCATVIQPWCTSNSITSTPIDSGAALVAYYGGFGMPTIVILAGTTHKVIYTDIGFTASDTIAMKDSINKFFNPGSAGIIENKVLPYSIHIAPNPASNVLNINMQIKDAGNLSMDIMDITGKLTSATVRENVEKGTYSKNINIADLAGGLYIVKVTLNGETSYSKLAIAK